MRKPLVGQKVDHKSILVVSPLLISVLLASSLGDTWLHGIWKKKFKITAKSWDKECVNSGQPVLEIFFYYKIYITN